MRAAAAISAVAAHVDHLDRLVERHRARAHLWREGPDVDDHQVNQPDALRGQLRHLLGHLAPGEDAAVDLRMECLDLSAGERLAAGQGADRLGLDTRLGQRGARAVGGEQLDPECGQIARKVDDPVAIRDREQGSHRLLLSLALGPRAAARRERGTPGRV